MIANSTADADQRHRPAHGSAIRKRLRHWTPDLHMVLTAVALAALTLLILIPMALLVYGSFRTDSPGFPADFTLENYNVLTAPQTRRVVLDTLQMGVGGTIVATLVGGTLAAALVRGDVPGRRLLDTLVVAPAYMAPFIGAIAWTLLLSPDIGYINRALRALSLPTINIYSMGGIIFVVGVYLAPVAYLYIRPALVNIDPATEEAARIFGSTRWRTTWRVTLPLVMPALLSALLVIFVSAIGQFGIPSVLGNQVNIRVISTEIVRQVRSFPSSPNRAAVLGLALTGITALGLWLSQRLLARHDYTSIGGRGSAEPPPASPRSRFLQGAFVYAYITIAVVLPLFAMTVASLQPFLSPRSWSVGWTLDNYRYVFETERVRASIVNSVVLAILAAVAGTVIAVVLGFAVARTPNRFTRSVEQIAMIPLAIPHSVMGLSLIWLWLTIPVGVYGTRWMLLLAYTALFLPYAMRAAVSGFAQLDRAVEESARVIGAGWMMTLIRVTLPLLRPALVSGMTITIYHAVRELEASVLLVSPGSEVMAVSIWDLYSAGRYVELLALSVVNVALTFGLVAILNRQGRSLQKG